MNRLVEYLGFTNPLVGTPRDCFAIVWILRFTICVPNVLRIAVAFCLERSRQHFQKNGERVGNNIKGFEVQLRHSEISKKM